MAKTQAEHQAKYREKIRQDKKQINHYVSKKAYNTLARIAAETGLSKQEALDRILQGELSPSDDFTVSSPGSTEATTAENTVKISSRIKQLLDSKIQVYPDDIQETYEECLERLLLGIGVSVIEEALKLENHDLKSERNESNKHLKQLVDSIYSKNHEQIRKAMIQAKLFLEKQP